MAQELRLCAQLDDVLVDRWIAKDHGLRWQSNSPTSAVSSICFNCSLLQISFSGGTGPGGPGSCLPGLPQSRTCAH